ncbi:hypothetical protein [Pseudalkalibacillus hwajinpoensis]|uniref:TOMM leader peptide-binding protein n=1 Tax=Guptibacillus hwajinpoensis TaxID=208199 RepID=A0A4U1MFU8_9BACL|nr:hypothetical protein [Pseudalkalibacillus hwajinpoensis]TKD69773.1 hypothetical protein FBF83_10825 [Pseudalkalibacillus hwajinpoensis]
MNYPIIRNYFYEIISSNELIFFYNKKNLTFTGKSVGLIIKILPFLNGEYKTEDISVETSIGLSQVEEIIQLLINKRIVFLKHKVNNLQTINNEQSSLFNSINNNNLTENDALEEFSNITLKKVYVEGESTLVGKLVNAVQEILVVTTKQDEADLIIGIDNYENKTLFSKLNDLSLSKAKPFIKAVIEEQEYNIGPIFSTKSSCYICYWNRLYSNYQNPKKDWQYYEKYNENVKDKYYFPGLEEMFINSLKINIIKFFGSYRSQLFFNEYNYNPIKMEGNLNYILKVPGCARCKEVNYIEELGYEVSR